jgi:hypothetical protein
MENIAFQPELSPAIPTVYGPKEYSDFRARLEEIDRVLRESKIEHFFIVGQISLADDAKPSQRQYRKYRSALRYGILLGITQLSYRGLAFAVADSNLFQWFVGAAQIDGIRPLGKRSIERLEKLIPSDEIRKLVDKLNQIASDSDAARDLLYRDTALRMDSIFADSTCVEANIHFPVDWVLLRDAARTLINAVVLIRSKGLKHRIAEPRSFLRRMNRLCIEMVNTRRKKDSRKNRKRILRRMKSLMKVIEAHGRNYRDLLAESWEQSGFSEAEAQVVLDRIDNILDQLPQAVRQAHERIIGGRKVASADKILSLYEPDIHVIVRGKAGAEVEFGNSLYLAEQEDGLIVDWQLHREKPSSDSRLVKSSLGRISAVHGKPGSYTADRGFDSKEVRQTLEQADVANGICPRSPRMFQERLEDDWFCRLQSRRSQTEARIGIFKNAYLGRPLRSKGFANRQCRIAWCVLSHNLWKLGSIAAEEKLRRSRKTA